LGGNYDFCAGLRQKICREENSRTVSTTGNSTQPLLTSGTGAGRVDTAIAGSFSKNAEPTSNVASERKRSPYTIFHLQALNHFCYFTFLLS
jgi:hypothetical protein